MPAPATVVIDDHLLVAYVLGDALPVPRTVRLLTTEHWYFRAARAAAAGGGGRLSGPFQRVPAEHQARAITAMLALPDEVHLPDPRALVPHMVEVARRHPKLNVLNVEAAAAARLLGATLLLSAPAAEGVLPPVLDEEGITWGHVDIGPLG